MEISLAKVAPATLKTGTLVVGAYADGSLLPAAQAVDQAAGGALSAALKRGDLDEKAGATLVFPALGGVGAERVLLVSLGQRAALGDRPFRDAVAAVAKVLAGGVAKDAAVALVDVDLPNRTPAWRVRTAARLLADGAYKFDAPRAKPAPARGASRVTLIVESEPNAELSTAVKTGVATAEGMALTKDLGNLGGNVCTPGYMAETAQRLGKEFGFEVEVLERADMEKLGMHSALSVGRASYSPCKFIVMKYSKGGTAKPIVLIGKGMTFDTGGVSLKPGANLDEMKYDMCGGGSVIGAFRTVAKLGLADQSGRPCDGGREHAGRQCQPTGRRRQVDGGHHDRDPQHRRRRAPRAVRCDDLRRALRAGVRDRPRHADRRLRDRTRRACERTVRERRRAGGGTAGRRHDRRRPCLADCRCGTTTRASSRATSPT